MNYACINGDILPADQPALAVDNRGYRYGDGIFETMKVIKGQIILSGYHFDRFFNSLHLLKFEWPVHFTKEKLSVQILSLCEKNQCNDLARVRLSASRGQGGLYEERPGFHYIIECWPVSDSVNELNANGLVIDVYQDARKSSDMFSHIKSANFLPYIMAAQHARENKLNDCLVLNHQGRVADATIANLFMLKNGILITPPLTEGCIDGVMRRYLLEKCRETGYRFGEKPVSPADLEQADEVFLTNAMNGIRWVRQCGNRPYSNFETIEIYKRFITGALLKSFL